MNRPLRRIALAIMIVFGVMLVNLNYLQAVESQDLNSKPGNKRIQLAEYSRKRGDILVAGRPVASSVATKGEYKYLRRYPDQELYAAATGFYSRLYGSSGVEREMGSILSGTDDSLFIRRFLDTVTGKDPQGGDVVLTLDPKAQRAAHEGLQALGSSARGAVVAIRPRTGAIVAFASAPTYDPNRLSTHDVDELVDAWKDLEGDDLQPLLARPVARTYPPGSTFKIVTAAAALSSGKYTVDSKLPGPARLDLPQTTVDLPNFDSRPCEPSGAETTTFVNALRRSCNTTFGALGLELGDDALREQAQKFGFDSDTLDIPVDVAPSAFSENPDKPQTAQSAIGQFDVRATPLQMAMVVAGIANQGVVMKPYLVDRVLAQDTTPIETTRPEQLSEAVTPEVAQQLTEMLVDVVETGTGSNARIDGISVAGKTGTAQQSRERSPHAWFVSFAPAENPEVAVAVVVEDGGGVDRAEVGGNRLAAPIAKRVMEAVLRP